MSRPLEGIRVLDFTHVLAGPFGTRILADMGADVVKVNSAERARANNAAGSPYYVLWNRNKRALALNMKDERAVAVALKLAEVADVVIDNFSIGVLDRWGIGYDQVAKVNQAVIYAQMSGMGDSGPWKDFVSYAPTVHALAGLTYTTGTKGHEPIGIGFSYNDHMAGLHAACAILIALEARRRLGIGQKIDLSQLEVATSLLGPAFFDYFANGKAAEPSGNKLPYDEIAPHGCYPCQSIGDNDDILDERWIAIVCATEEQWHLLAGYFDHDEWIEDERFSTLRSRWTNAEVLDGLIAEQTSQYDCYELMSALQAVGVPAGVVQSGQNLVEHDAQLQQTEFLSSIAEEHPVIGQTFAERLPIYFERTPCDTYLRSRLVGEDNHTVLRDWLGMTAHEVEKGEDDGYLS